MRRREFISLLGAAAAWPVAARAQQPVMPVIGFLDGRSPDALTDRLRGFRQGLKDTGYVEGENVVIVYRWAENQFDRLTGLADDLVRRQVNVIVASGGVPAISAAKAATSTLPVVFIVGDDPVRLGVVPSLARPGGNLTGVNFFNIELAAKQLGLLRELVPAATRVAALINPANAAIAETTLRELESAARAMGLQFRSSAPAPAVRSMRPRRLFCASGRMPFSSAAIPSSTLVVSSCPFWQCATRSPRHIWGVNMPRPAG
jgi:putative tryptophan/tyrosine transport system substrate-binding protein